MSDKLSSEEIVTTILGLIFSIPVTIYGAFMVQWMWAHFIVTTFQSIPIPSIPALLGIGVIISFYCSTFQKSTKGDDLLVIVISRAIVITILWFTGWIYSLFM